MTFDVYKANPVCLLSPYNYKVEALIGRTRTLQSSYLTVLDTGAGPNLIRSDCLDSEALATIDTSPDIVSLASATKHRLDTLGIVTLTVTVAGYTSRQPFVVVKELGTDAILGCTFLDSAVESIHPRKRYALVRNGNRTRLVRQLALEPRKERRTVCHRVARPKDLTILRVAQRAVLAPYTETVVLVNTGKRGPVLLEASDETYRRKKVSLANGVAHVQPNVAFPVRIANMSSKEVILQKHERVGTAVPLSTAANVDMVNSQPDQNTDQNDGDTVSPTDLDDLELDHLPTDLQTRVREFLAPFSELWSGRLGTVRLTEHRIKLKPESEPVFSQPYSL